MTFYCHTSAGRIVLGYPEHLVLGTIHAGAGPSHQLIGEDVCHGGVVRSEGPRHRPRRSLRMAPPSLRPGRRLRVGQDGSSAASRVTMNDGSGGGLSLVLCRWRRSTTANENRAESRKS